MNDIERNAKGICTLHNRCIFRHTLWYVYKDSWDGQWAGPSFWSTWIMMQISMKYGTDLYVTLRIQSNTFVRNAIMLTH